MKVYLRVTKEIPNPIRDKRAQYGNKSRGPFTVGECVQVITPDSTLTGCTSLYRKNSNEDWNVDRLPPLAEWTEPTTPTDLEWFTLEHSANHVGWHLLELLKKGIVTRAHIEALDASEDDT